MARGPAHNRGEGVREANGRLSRKNKADRRKNVRDLESSIATEAAVWQREKLLKEEGFKKRISPHLLVDGKLPKSVLLDEKIGTTHGRLLYIGPDNDGIDKDQWEAADWFLKLRNQYHCAIASPDGIYDVDEGHNPSDDPEAYAEFCANVRARWADVEKAICDTVFSYRDRNIVGALDLIIIRQYMDYDRVGDLRLALNAIHKIRVGDRKKAA